MLTTNAAVLNANVGLLLVSAHDQTPAAAPRCGGAARGSSSNGRGSMIQGNPLSGRSMYQEEGLTRRIRQGYGGRRYSTCRGRGVVVFDVVLFVGVVVGHGRSFCFLWWCV